jgi:hypothetical protein
VMDYFNGKAYDQDYVKRFKEVLDPAVVPFWYDACFSNLPRYFFINFLNLDCSECLVNLLEHETTFWKYFSLLGRNQINQTQNSK